MAGPLDFFSIIGADLSFVTVFLSFVPLVISCNSALCADCQPCATSMTTSEHWQL